MQLVHWPDLANGRADSLDGVDVEVGGWIAPIDIAERHDYFLLVAEPLCCLGCLPNDPTACVEVFAAEAIAPSSRPVRLAGSWRRLIDDPAGWHYQLRDARLVDGWAPASVTRRTLLSAGAMVTVASCAPAAGGSSTDNAAERDAAARQLVRGPLNHALP